MSTETAWIVYGAAGSGSAMVEAFLTWCALPFERADVVGFDTPGLARDRLLAFNPLAQSPTVVLPGGEVMTESAALALLIDERAPQARLAPRPGTALRARFLRRLTWISAALYGTFAYTDYPARWVPPAGAEAFRDAVRAHRQRLWRDFEDDCGPGEWVLGADVSALDIFVSVMTRWNPGRAWFEAECPKLFAIARRADVLALLQPVWSWHFPEGSVAVGGTPQGADAP